MDTSQKLNIIIDSLRSCTNWDTIDLEKDFNEFISTETGLSDQRAEKILKDFLSINPLTRDDMNFNFDEFLSSYEI